MSDMTAGEIITAAYRKNGIRSVSTQQTTDGLQDLQNMLDSWSADGLVVPYFVTENFTLTSGQAVYTIGVAGDSPDLTTATGRPLRITNAFIRISNIDHNVSVDMTKSEYAQITAKNLEQRPTALYYDPQYPNGTIKFNFEADSAYDFHIVSEKPLTNPTATSTTFSIPLYINRALIYNLAIELAPDADNQLPTEVFMIAGRSLDILERMHSVDKLIDKVSLDNTIVINNRSHMNFDSGE